MIKKTMKYGLIYVFTAVFIATSGGVWVFIHHCTHEGESRLLFSETDECCPEHKESIECCGVQQDEYYSHHTNCCNTETQYLKINDFYTFGDNIKKIFSQQSFVLNWIVCKIFDNENITVTISNHRFAFIVPPDCSPIIKNCQYLL